VEDGQPENAKKEKQAKTTKGEKKASANPQMVSIYITAKITRLNSIFIKITSS
jgi:hypothetical protein